MPHFSALPCKPAADAASARRKTNQVEKQHAGENQRRAKNLIHAFLKNQRHAWRGQQTRHHQNSQDQISQAPARRID